MLFLEHSHAALECTVNIGFAVRGQDTGHIGSDACKHCGEMQTGIAKAYGIVLVGYGHQ